jgi:hypothetical protein
LILVADVSVVVRLTLVLTLPIPVLEHGGGGGGDGQVVTVLSIITVTGFRELVDISLAETPAAARTAPRVKSDLSGS